MITNPTTDTEDTGDNFADPDFYDPDRHCYDMPNGDWTPAPAYDYDGILGTAHLFANYA